MNFLTQAESGTFANMRRESSLDRIEKLPWRIFSIGGVSAIPEPSALGAEIRLDQQLARKLGDADRQSNALRRQLVDFERTLDQRVRLRGRLE